MRCLRSGGRIDSRILFSCSLAAEDGPWLDTTEEAETRGGGEMVGGDRGGAGEGGLAVEDTYL